MTEVEKSLKEKYPDVIPKCKTLISSDLILNDFSIDDIAKLCLIENDIMYNALLFLNSYHREDSFRQILIYIMKCDTEKLYKIFNKKNLKNSMTTIIDVFIELVEKQPRDFSTSWIEENKDVSRSFRFNINYYFNLINTCKLYQNKKVTLKDIKPFTDFHMNFYKKLLIKSIGNYNNIYDNTIYSVVMNLLNGKLKISEYLMLMKKGSDSIERIAALNKFGLNTYNILLHTDKIPFLITMQINQKKINNIYKEIMKYPYVNTLNSEGIILFLIKFSALIKEENVDNVIRHLPDDKEGFFNLYYNILKFDLENINYDNEKIVYNEEFIKFFIGDNLKQPYSLLNLTYQNRTSLIYNLNHLYINFDILNSRFKKQNHFTKSQYFEYVLNKKKILLRPDEYVLEGDIIDTCVADPSFQNLSEQKIVYNIREIYSKMRYYFKKSIPYIKGTYGKYRYETLKASDPYHFILGSATKCCYRIGGDADSLIRYIINSEYGRVVVIKNENNEIEGMIPILRNGNIIICNSVESLKVKNMKEMKELFEVLEHIGSEFIKISKKYENDEERIKALVVGNYKNKIHKFNKYEKVDNNISLRLIPIHDEGETIYNNLGENALGIYIIKKELSLSKIDFDNLFKPSHIYYDPREEVYEVELDMLNDYEIESIQKIIDSINYELSLPNIDVKSLIRIEFNKDWYIGITNDYKLYNGISSKDKRAYVEYLEYLKLEAEFISYPEISLNT